MCYLNRESSIETSYQVSVHLAMRFQSWRFLEIGQPEKRIPMAMTAFYWLKWPSIDGSYHVLVHLAMRFRGEDFQKLTNQKQNYGSHVY